LKLIKARLPLPFIEEKIDFYTGAKVPAKINHARTVLAAKLRIINIRSPYT
jgi:hypothetical protein